MMTRAHRRDQQAAEAFLDGLRAPRSSQTMDMRSMVIDRMTIGNSAIDRARLQLQLLTQHTDAHHQQHHREHGGQARQPAATAAPR